MTVIPASFSQDVTTWCSKCGRFARLAEMDEKHICMTCRGGEIPPGSPFGALLTVEEMEARVEVSVERFASWTISRDDVPGWTDLEWRLLLGALKAPFQSRTKEQKALIAEAGEALVDDDWTPDYDDTTLRLR